MILTVDQYCICLDHNGQWTTRAPKAHQRSYSLTQLFPDYPSQQTSGFHMVIAPIDRYKI